MDRTAKQPQKAASRGPFQCTACRRTYTRVDHLARHVRSHLQERPFKCQTCQKAFGRPDLLKRHLSCHEGDQNGSRSSKRQFSSAPRVSQACISCAAAKIKCTDDKPCNRCLLRGITCEYASESPDQAIAVLGNVLSRTDAFGNVAVPLPRPPSASNAIDVAVGDADVPIDSIRPLTPETSVPSQATEVLSLSPAPSFVRHDHNMSGFLREVITPTCPPSNFMHIDSSGPHGLLDFTVDGDLDLDDTDFGFLDQLYNDPFCIEIPLSQQKLQSLHHHENLPPQYQQQQPSQEAQQTQEMPSRQQLHQPQLQPVQNHHMSEETPVQKTTRQHVALGAEAFRRSALGVWLPAQQDCGDVELENLSILSPEVGSPDARINLDRRCLREGLSRTTRDEFLAMILRTCRPERVGLVVRTFPTSGLLGDLIECFFAHHRQQVDSFIHAPFFQPNQQKLELLGAIIAAGATKTDVKALRKLGFAMQEAVRTILPHRCEEANATTRELWLVQAFMCELQIGIWSGIKRKMEIAESHTQVVFTMLRRAGRFQPPKRVNSEPLLQDTGEILHRKWLNWVEHESLKRLAFNAFICDAQVSMTMLTNPIISYTELSIPFPESRDLWMAEDAEQWKALYLKRTMPQERQLGLLDFLQQPADISDYYDVPLASLAILYGVWGMVWQHLQLTCVLNRRGDLSSQPTAAYVALRQQGLLQTLHHFRVNIACSQVPPCPETTLVLEVLHMYLHVNFGGLQLFAGKGDLEDARQVLPYLQQWVTSPEARRAIWHAGQVLRTAAAFSPQRLERFYAVAVYHAGLTLWAYGVVSQARGTNNTTTSIQSTTTHVVCLDDLEGPALQRFLTLGRDSPTVGFRRGSGDPLPTGGHVPLSDPEAVMNVVVETLRENFPANNDAEEVPPLVENLIQLLRDLGRAAGNVGK